MGRLGSKLGPYRDDDPDMGIIVRSWDDSGKAKTKAVTVSQKRHQRRQIF